MSSLTYTGTSYTLMIWLRDIFNFTIPTTNYVAILQHLRPNNRSVTFITMDASNYFFCEFEVKGIGSHHISVVVKDHEDRYYWVYDHTITITKDNSALLRAFGSGSVMANRMASNIQFEGMLKERKSNIGIFYMAYVDENDNILDTRLSVDDFLMTAEHGVLLTEDINLSDLG